MPAWIEYPIPTPPPWCTLTQCAPAAVLTSAFRIGQSAMASEPSFMPSVSRYGDATLPASRWSRPITIGADTSPRATRSLNTSPALSRSPYPSQQIRAGSPWNATRSSRQRQPALEAFVLGEQLGHRAVGPVDVLRIAGERRPAERALALAEQRPDERRHEPRIRVRARRAPGRRAPLRHEGCSRSRTPPTRLRGTRPSRRRGAPWTRTRASRSRPGRTTEARRLRPA